MRPRKREYVTAGAVAAGVAAVWWAGFVYPWIHAVMALGTALIVGLFPFSLIIGGTIHESENS